MSLGNVIVSFLSITFVTLTIEATSNYNVTLIDHLRRPRVSGRIVKLYSGTRPAPFLCPDEGFQADPIDCAIFYRCVKASNGRYTVFRFQCGPGTVYDPDTQICNHPGSTKRSACGGSSPPATEDSHENEIDVLQSEFPSPISTKKPVYTDQTIQSTNPWATSTKRQNSGASVSTANPWVTTKSDSSTPSKTIDISRPNGQNGNPCTSEGFMGDSDNCRKFYRCVSNQRGGFIRYEFSCSESTIWDEDAQSCNHQWAVQRLRCGRGKTNDDKHPSSNEQPENNRNIIPNTNIQQQLQLSYGSKVSQTQTQISHGPVIQNQTQINFGDRENNQPKRTGAKQNQTQISHGSAVSQSQTQIDYGDKGVQTQLQVDHTKDSSQMQSQVYETTAKSSTTLSQPDEPDAGYGIQNVGEAESDNDNGTDDSDSECKESGFMGDKNNCKKFYRCVNYGKGSYTKYEFLCGEGTVWDSTIDACNHEWAVKECGSNAPVQSLPQSESTTTTTQNYYTTSGSITDNEDTGYGNQNQQPVTTSSTTESTIKTTQPFAENADYDAGYGQSQNESPGTTTTTTRPQNQDDNQCKSSGFMGDNNDCKKFYRCVDNGNGAYTRYEFSCGEGTVWDDQIEACNHAWAVEKCGKDDTADIDKGTTAKPNPTMSDEEINTGTTLNEKEVETTTLSSSSSSSTTTVSTVSNESNDCQQSGFMGDMTDCKKFYRCVDNGRGGFIRYEFSCGEGTVWDQSIEACNHAWAVKKCGNTENLSQVESTTQPNSNSPTIATEGDQGDGSSTEKITTTTGKDPSKPAGDICNREGFFGDHADCKKFYRCVDNGQGGYIKYEFTCGDGTVWDPEINACNHPSSDRNCSGSNNNSTNKEPSVKEPVQENDEMFTETTSVPITSTENSVYPSTTNKTETSGDTCKSEGFYGDPNDCKKFYRCVDNGKGGYTKYDFTCGDGTVWDQEIQSCNHDSTNKACAKNPTSSSPMKPSSESSENYVSTTTTSSNEDHQITDITETPASNLNDQCSDEGFFANSNDCKKFYRCVSNSNGGFIKYDFACGEGTVWVQDIQACDHDNGISNCSEQSEPSTGTKRPSYEQQSTTDASSNSETTSSQPQKPDKENDEYPIESSSKPTSSNDDQCTSEGFYANKNDCKLFYRCVDNGNGGYTKYDFACGEGTAWDSELQTCNHIKEVKSCQDSNQQYVQSQSKPVMQDEETSQTTESSSTTNGSTTSGSTTEGSKPMNNDKCEQEGYYGNTEDCKKFYRCVDNGKGGFTKYDFDCGEGTIWDQDLTTCNHPQDVANPSCQQNENNFSPSSTSPPTSSSTSQTSDTTESSQQGSSNCSQEDSSKKPEKQNITCTEAGYFADPNDCKKFYRCVDWDGDGKRFSVYHFNCGEGTIWDPALDTCNHEDSVYPPRDCSGSQSQNENVNNESTTTEESTTQQPMTTQSSTTNEQTTQESTTMEQTTMQQTSEQTTTQQSTTSEQATSQQTTSEQTTTQQTTTSEQTTTQQSTTSEQTTAQQTTSEQTTTEQTTSEHTTTQQSTTSEQTTTEQTNASEQTTTQQSTTSEQTTSKPSTTDYTTTQQSTDGTTEQSTTTENNNQQSTTEDSTTIEGNLTEESTTEESTSTTQQTDENPTSESGQETTESSSSSNDKCPKTEDDQNVFVCPTSFRRHPKYCNLFYQCTEDDDNHDVKIAVFNCPNNTIYDESKTKCVEEDQADKECDGEKAQRRRVKRLDANYKEPITASKKSLKCPAVGYYPFENEECSSGFLKCQMTKTGKLRGFVYQCPKNHVYWSVSKRCEAQSNVRFCKQSYTNWRGRWEIPIERRNVAP